MRGTITISSSYGSAGAPIGHAVAERLGLNFYDRAIPVAVAQQLNIDPDDAIALDSKAPGRLERVLSALANVSLPIGIAEMPTDLGMTPNRFKEATEAILHQIADGEGGVVLGRASMAVLANRPDVLSVRLSGPVEARIAAEVLRVNRDEATVRAEQKSTDSARETYSQAFYGVRQSDPKLYHLTIDSTFLSQQACTDMIVTAALDRFADT